MYKNILRIGLVVFVTLSIHDVFAQKKQAKEPQVEITTAFGSIRIKLFNETPQHRDNFIKLVETSFYDSLLFHRVLQNFMIQGGDPSSKRSPAGSMLGMGGNGYTIPAEIRRNCVHTKGALAAARLDQSVNPKKESSGCQFYIVQGTAVTTQSLDSYETRRIEARQNELIVQLLQQPQNASLQQSLELARQRNSRTAFDSAVAVIKQRLSADFKNLDSLRYTPDQRKAYVKNGGTPHLDFEYTVFGEVVDGMEVIEEIARQEVDRNGRPLHDIIMSIKVIK